jgi:hypothetical protein
MKLTTDLHLVPMLRMSGAIPLLPLYAFMTWAGRTLTFTFFIVCVNYKFPILNCFSLFLLP